MDPSVPSQFLCIVCDDARAEVGGKLTVLGFMPGSKIEVPPGRSTISINLTFIFVFEDIVGSFSGTFTLTGPNGVIGQTVPMPPATHNTPNTLVSVYQFKPTPPIPLGNYVARVVMNDRTYEKKFEIRTLPAVSAH
jgi:hypothetical protein